MKNVIRRRIHILVDASNVRHERAMDVVCNEKCKETISGDEMSEGRRGTFIIVDRTDRNINR